MMFKIEIDGVESPDFFELKDISSTVVTLGASPILGSNINNHYQHNRHNEISFETSLLNKDFVFGAFEKSLNGSSSFSKFDTIILDFNENIGFGKLSLYGLFIKNAIIMNGKIEVKCSCDYYSIDEITLQEKRKFKLEKLKEYESRG